MAQGQPAPAKAQPCGGPFARFSLFARFRTPVANRNPAPVAERVTDCGPPVSGALLRVSTAPDPALMFSPFAPPEYGSARALVTFTDDPNRNSNPNIRSVQPNGIRLWSIWPDW